MKYRIGEPVIVTQDGVNRVGVILDQYLISKQLMYDVLLETRSAIGPISATSKGNYNYINQSLTTKLCESQAITPTFSYKELAADDLLPICKTYSAGKASW